MLALHLKPDSLCAEEDNAAVTAAEGDTEGDLSALKVKEESDVVADADAEEGTTAVTTAEGDIEVETRVKAPKPRLPKANNRLTVRLLAAARHALAHPESGARLRRHSSAVLLSVARILGHEVSWVPPGTAAC